VFKTLRESRDWRKKANVLCLENGDDGDDDKKSYHNNSNDNGNNGGVKNGNNQDKNIFVKPGELFFLLFSGCNCLELGFVSFWTCLAELP